MGGGSVAAPPEGGQLPPCAIEALTSKEVPQDDAVTQAMFGSVF
jgi:hypothetical protein